jgi:high-affinity iron transporter
VLFLSLLVSFASLASEEAKKMLSLVDYIGGDYTNAVKGGRIINEEEYKEMQEFSSEALRLFEGLKVSGGDKAGIEWHLSELKKRIEDKSPVEDIESISKEIKTALISAYNLTAYPKNHPSFQKGKELYEVNCSQCHGVLGAGDGQLSPNLNPPPTNFTDGGSAGGLSPFKVYNTMSFGIEGTAMPSFPKLSEDNKWDVAFHVASLRASQKEADEGKEILNRTGGIPQEIRGYKKLATLTDDEIMKQITPYIDRREDVAKVVAFLRSEAETKPKADNPLVLTGALLKEAVDLYQKGNREDAYSKALDAYLEGFERVEPKLAVRNSELTSEIEAKFSSLRAAMGEGHTVEQVLALYTEVNSSLDRASSILEDAKPVDKTLSFANSLAIIVREGLEAALIVAAIIAFLTATGASSAIKYVHLGWISALVAGLLTWVLAQTVISISGARREIIEGVTSLIAAVVLFYVSYWLITKIEVKKWKEYIQAKTRRALTKKSVFALASVSFFAVYREAFETVLFYQALWLQSENSQGAVIWGLITGVVLLLCLVVVIFRLGLKIPLKYFFSITSCFLYFLSFVLVGKGIREFQEAGVVGLTPLDFIPQIDLLGVYPTLETTAPQAILLLAFIAAILWTNFIKREREKKEIAVSVSRIADDMKSMHEAFEHIKGHIIEWKRCQEIDLEAQELDNQIQDVIGRVDELENKLEDFFDMILKNKETAQGFQAVDKPVNGRGLS